MAIVALQNALSLQDLDGRAGSITQDSHFLRRIIREEKSQYQDLGDVSGNIVIDMSKSRIDMIAIGDINFSYFNSAPEGMINECTLRITNGGARNIDFGPSEWQAGLFPLLSTAGQDEIAINFAHGEIKPSLYLIALDIK